MLMENFGEPCEGFNLVFSGRQKGMLMHRPRELSDTHDY